MKKKDIAVTYKLVANKKYVNTNLPPSTYLVLKNCPKNRTVS